MIRSERCVGLSLNLSADSIFVDIITRIFKIILQGILLDTVKCAGFDLESTAIRKIWEHILAIGIYAIRGLFGGHQEHFWVIRTFGAIGAIGGHQGYQWYSVGLSWLRGAIWGLSELFGCYWSHFGAIVAMWGPVWVIQGLFQGLEGGYHTYSLGLTLACNYSI